MQGHVRDDPKLLCYHLKLCHATQVSCRAKTTQSAPVAIGAKCWENVLLIFGNVKNVNCALKLHKKWSMGLRCYNNTLCRLSGKRYWGAIYQQRIKKSNKCRYLIALQVTKSRNSKRHRWKISLIQIPPSALLMNHIS